MSTVINETASLNWVESIPSAIRLAHSACRWLTSSITVLAWGVSECYVRAPERCEAFLKNNRMPDWTQNKAISKIRDSRRVPEADKGRLLGYRR